MPQARPTPSAPAVPAAPNVVTPQMLTARDVAALKARGDELSTQIRSASGRRRETRDALKSATGSDKVGLEQRLTVLDARIAGLEADIAENGRQLASVEAMKAVAQDQPRFQNPGRGRSPGMPDNAVPVLIMFILFVLCPIAISMSRFLWRRGSVAKQSQAPNPEHTQRLERIEQAIDSIAIEVERVSEGQRFVTRILSEGGRQAAMVGGGQQAAQPLAVAQLDKLGQR